MATNPVYTVCLLAKHLSILLLLLCYAWGKEKVGGKLSVEPGERKKQTGHNVVTICMKGLHHEMAMANLVVCPVSPGKREKTHLNWAADVQGWVGATSATHCEGKNEAPQISHKAIPMGPLCTAGTALLKMGSMEKISQGRGFQVHLAPHQQHLL